MGLNVYRYAIRLAIVTATVLLPACTASYQYRANGEIEAVDGGRRGAVLYWHKDEGRLWYGRKYEQVDTSLTMRICGQLPKIFALDEQGERVELLAKSGDLRVATITADGDLDMLDAIERGGPGMVCGLILLDGEPVVAAELAVGDRPVAAIVCRNPSRPDRYPVVATYPFAPVSRVRIDDERLAPDPCGKP